MNPTDFKLAIHGGLWQIIKALKPGDILELENDGSGLLGDKIFNDIDELVDLLIVAKQEEAKNE